MARRVSQGAGPGWRAGAAALAWFLALGRAAPAQQDDTYRPPVHVGEDEVALGYIVGRFASPVTCKRADGSALELEQAIVIKAAPEAGGGDLVRVTFFGIDVADAAYCYNLVERRVLDRRGSILVRFRSYNRKDLGTSDFRRALAAGPVTYNAHAGEINVRGIGSDPGDITVRALTFDGGDSRMVLEPIVPGTDGAKLLANYDPHSSDEDKKNPPRRFGFHFYAKDGSDFVLYAVEDLRKQRQR